VKIVGLVQAHYLGWAGAQDLSLARVGGKYAVEEVIDRLQAMPQIDAVTIAVPDDPGNEIFREIAVARGASCFFGSRENVLARVTAALDAVGADVAVHVMGQHCFVDTALLADMLEFMREKRAKFVSLPDAFTPYFAGKVYSRALLDEVGDAIGALPGDQAIHFARYAAFITTRIKAIARKAGAPVNADPKCRHNIQILFAAKPQEVGDALRKGRAYYLGWFDNMHQADELAKVTHDIQAWYLTATVDYNGGWHVDLPRANFFNNNSYGFTGGNDGDYVGVGRIGGRINNGIASYLHNVIIVADSGKLKDYEIGSLADYIAMLALSRPKSFDACWEVPSITNLLAKDCEKLRKTATLSDNDAAFLHGLYKMGAGDSEFRQRAEIRYFVQRHKEPR